MGEAYRQGRAARAELIGDLASEMQQADNGAPPPEQFTCAGSAPDRTGRRIRLALASKGAPSGSRAA